jgi:hypothetical protein
MNFLNLRAALRRSIKNPGEEDVPETDLGEYINEGYRDLAGRYRHHQTRKRCTFVTVASQAKYQLPGDLASVLRLRDNTHGRKLRKTGDRTIASRFVPTFEHWPSAYVRYRHYVELVPTPDADGYVIEVWYIAIPALLTLDTDIPVLPETWDRGIVLRAKWHYLTDRGTPAQATEALNNYTIWVSDKPSEIDEESVDIDSAVEVPDISQPLYSSRSSRFDDGLFDFRE